MYCNGNPIMFVDPWGLYDIDVDKKGNVYAVIESGDTLSSIAKAEVNDASAWGKIGYKGDPNSLQVGERININGIYNENYPKLNVIMKHMNPFGDIKGVYYRTYLFPLTELDRLNSDDYYINVDNGFEIVVTSKDAVAEVKAIKKEHMDFMFSIAAGTKADIKQVSAVAKSLKMTPKQAELFKREIEFLKSMDGKRNNMNFSYETLKEIGKEIIDMFK